MSAPQPGPYGAYACGCTIGKLHAYLSIDYCPTHEAAPLLAETLRALLADIEDHVDTEDRADGTPAPNWAMRLMQRVGYQAKAAISKAEGK